MTAADIAIQTALAQLGKPYVWATADPNVGFDCSGLVYYCYKQAGVTLGRTTYQQILQGTHVPNIASALPGDLVFPESGHVQLYLGNNEIIEAPDFNEVVVRRKEWATSIQEIRRIDAAGGSSPVSPTGATDVSLSDLSGFFGNVNKIAQFFINTTMWLNMTYITAGVILCLMGVTKIAGTDIARSVKGLLSGTNTVGKAVKTAKAGVSNVGSQVQSPPT